MGTRIARLLAASALALGLACSDTAPVAAPARDRFYYPTGLAIRHVDDSGASSLCLGGAQGCHTQLFVASSNFDLRFDAASGGTVIALDVDGALSAYNATQPPPPLLPTSAGGVQLGVAQIGSFGGEIAILDETTCPGWGSTPQPVPQALVASRSQNTLYRLNIGTQGELTCAEGCSVGLESTFGDPYGVTVACGGFGQLAFVSYLRTPSSEGQLSQIDLAAVDGAAPPRHTSPRTQRDLGPNAPVHGTVFDPSSARLYATQRFAQSGFSPLRWFSLVTGESTVTTANIYSLVRGAELRGIALSGDTPPSRAYLALRIFDADTASSTGLRPIDDVAGALAVMDLTPGSDGQPSGQLLNVVPIDRGASEIRIVPRPVPAGGTRLRDLVAVTCTDDNTVALYDDDTGSVAKVFHICGGVPGEPLPVPCDPGNPLTGKQPFGLATEQLANGHARLYVGSFDRSWVNVIEIDPLAPTSAPSSWARIGPERP